MAKFNRITTFAALLALLVLQVASANAVAAGQPEGATVAGLSQVQPVSDSALRDLRGKSDLIGFGNGLTDVGIQVNQGSGTQSSTYNGTTLSGAGTQVQPLPSNITTTLQSLQQLFQRWRR